MDFINKYLSDAYPYATYLGKIGSALLILFIGWLIAKWVKRFVRIGLNRVGNAGIDATVKPLLAKLVQSVIILIAVLVALSFVGIPITSLVAVLAAAGLAIGLALQGTLSNIAAGIMLLVLRPLEVGEFVETPTAAGKVIELGLFGTTLKTADGLHVFVPNAQLWSNRIQNNDRYPVRRANINLGVAYDTDLDKAITIIINIMNDHPNALEEPAIPEVLVEEFADSSINLLIRCWLPKESWRADASDLRVAIKKELEEADIEIPFPQRVIHQAKP